MILVTKSPERIKPIELREYVNRLGPSMGQRLYFTSYRYGNLVPVFQDIPQIELQRFKEHTFAVLIVAGIANPRPLRQFARSISTNISELSFPDHHGYRQKDMDQIASRYRELKEVHGQIMVLTTEKDAMRLRDHQPGSDLQNDFHSVRIYVHFLNDDQEKFNRQIINYVSSNKRGSVLHQGEDS